MTGANLQPWKCHAKEHSITKDNAHEGVGNLNPLINFCGLSLDETGHMIQNRRMVMRGYPSFDLIVGSLTPFRLPGSCISEGTAQG